MTEYRKIKVPDFINEIPDADPESVFLKSIIAVSSVLKTLKPGEEGQTTCPICGNVILAKKFKKGYIAQCQNPSCFKALT